MTTGLFGRVLLFVLAAGTALTPIGAGAEDIRSPTVHVIQGGTLRVLGTGAARPLVLTVPQQATATQIAPPAPALQPLESPRPTVGGLSDTPTGVVVEPEPITPVQAPTAVATTALPDLPGPATAEGAAREPISASIRAVLTALQSAEGATARRRAAAVSAFYAERADLPAWVVDGAFTTTAEAIATRLRQADADGLDPALLAIPDLATEGPAGGMGMAERDVALSLAIVTFAEQASGGRVEPGRISPNITRKTARMDAATALRQVATALDPAAALDGFNPPHAAFAALREALAAVRARGEPEAHPEPIAEGPALKPGMRDVRVATLRARLGLVETGTATDAPTITDADLYDPAVVEAVKAYQQKAGIIPDGIIGPRTLAVLNGVDRDEEGEILANMEMWRWMPRDLGRDHVLVNVPEYMVRVVRDGVEIHAARVVVGTVKNQTPIFSDEMEYLVVNPYWNVPESIKVKEMLPEIQANPAAYFQRHGYEVLFDGQLVDPSRVIWDENAVKAVHIRQVPGEANALGNIKFMFPNQHAVYLHDTPSRKLFNRTTRAFSHGCVRVDEPLEFARAVLQGEPQWTAEKVQALYGGDERRLDLDRHLKVHIGYFTAWVDNAGTLQLRDDLYGHAGKVKAALGL
ncbi:L,D-transpeptidase family protein [Mongoliimonas terrestris]|uniref:L,D-transpeptidase family protein n=1 Tax=Mongoliimonas terrestris TaxID=1709001 RepID=UPI000AC5C193|nr:L,D-transpeptidase family protein [Mongoliimonas terrestris]